MRRGYGERKFLRDVCLSFVGMRVLRKGKGGVHGREWTVSRSIEGLEEDFVVYSCLYH